jgi:cytochrome c biogenesis protein CcmG, thiol:disulfide interchange protein DsbE
MTRMRKTLLAATVLCLVIAGCNKHETPNPAQPKASAPTATSTTPPAATPATATAAVGSIMPAYKAELLDGKPFDVAAERGNVVFLNLWATWCGPCRYEIPELQKLHTQYAAQGFKVIGVSLDESGKDAVQQFVTENSIAYPIVLDPEGKLANVFQTTVLPTSVLIDRNGKIVWKKYGLITVDAELMRALNAALAEKKT